MQHRTGQTALDMAGGHEQIGELLRASIISTQALWKEGKLALSQPPPPLPYVTMRGQCVVLFDDQTWLGKVASQGR
jgi:hypothetical protein